MATERQKKVARLIGQGSSIEAAMLEAGYGPGCVEGLAPQLRGILESAGQSTNAKTGRRATKSETAARSGAAPKRKTSSSGNADTSKTSKE